MKKLTLLIGLISTSIFADLPEIFEYSHEALGRSFMFTRPASYNIPMAQQLWHTLIYRCNKGPIKGALQWYPYYQHARRQSKAARFFLINCKNELLVAGDQTNLVFDRDVRAEWLNLPDNFIGTLSLSPEQRQAGFVLTYNQELGDLLDLSFLQGFWVAISIPISWVQNNLHICQTNVQNPGTTVPTDLIQAFDQPLWRFSKIRPKKKTRLRMAEVNIAFGRAVLNDNYFQIASYTYVSLPTGNKQNGKFTFDPVVGNNRHLGFGGGVNFQVLLNRDSEEIAWTFFVDLDGVWLLPNIQERTFSLLTANVQEHTFLTEQQQRPSQWSRFLLFVERNAPAGKTIQGVNLLTFDTKVHAYSMVDFSTGWRVFVNNLELTFGYGIWGHGKEKLHPQLPCETRCNPFNGDFGIAGNPGASPVAVTASRSTISQQAPNDVDLKGNPIFVPLKEGDIDLQSANRGSAINHRLFFAIGSESEGLCGSHFFGGGFFYEYAARNSAMSLWGVWLKVGTSF